MSSDAPSLLPHATEDLAAFAANVRFRDIPAPVIERMKTSILDSMGCCLFGATLPWTRMVHEMALAEGAAPVASIMGTGKRTSVALAALANATAGHAFELDDIHKESIVHPGSIALPVVAALAESQEVVDGSQFLAAITVGYEIGTRVGNAAAMGLFFRGFHPQGASGVFVAAASAAHMLGLEPGQTHHAFGIVGSQAGGLMAAQEGAMVKRLHSGRAAQSVIYSAQLAARGFTGISDVLEAGYGGYLSSYSNSPNASRLTDGLGSEWEAGKIGYKPHACVTSIHSALDALGHLMRTHHVTADDINRVEVGVSPMTFTHCAWTYRAQGVTAAQMNLYYGLAVMARDGMAFVAQYDASQLANPALLSFIERIDARVDPEIESMGAAYRHAARVAITCRDGHRHEHLILHRRGSPENPLSADDVEYKFRHVVGGCLPKAEIDRAIALVDTLDRSPDVRPLLSLMAAAARA